MSTVLHLSLPLACLQVLLSLSPGRQTNGLGQDLFDKFGIESCYGLLNFAVWLCNSQF